MRKKYTPKTAEQREAEMDGILKQLEDGVRQIFTSDNYVNYLDTMSRFRRYSHNNVILILQQYPEATLVASHADWKNKFHRYVKKGSSGIKVIVPTPKKITVEVQKTNEKGETETEIVEQRKTYFKVGHVFDISQTSGKELPEIAEKLTLDNRLLRAILNELLRTSPITIGYDDGLQKSSVNGYYRIDTQEIGLKRNLSAHHQIKTIAHEFSHYLQHTVYVSKIQGLDAAVQEVIAESCAYCVLQMLVYEYGMPQLDSSNYSFGYICHWSRNQELEELKAALSLIAQIANNIFGWFADCVSAFVDSESDMYG